MRETPFPCPAGRSALPVLLVAASVGIAEAQPSWKATTTAGAPAARFGHTAVWTGSKMIVFGGWDNGAGYANTGGIYDPSTDSWRATNNAVVLLATDGSGTLKVKNRSAGAVHLVLDVNGYFE